MYRRIMKAVAVTASVTLSLIVVPSPAFADETRDRQWYLDSFEIEKVHELSQGEGITIGVVDSGIDAEHPDLKGNVKAGKDFADSKGNGLKDADGHGTSVASLMVGKGHGNGNEDGVLGIAPKAKIVSAGFNCTKKCYGGDIISEAIIWLVDEGVDIISISLGSGHYDNKAVGYATEKGVPVVASAGNDDPNELEKRAGAKASTTTHWPASAVGAMPVSGTARSGEFWQHSLTLKDAAAQPQLGLSAPAENLVAAKKGGGYINVSGTSGSAPLVAGTLALIKSAYPDLSHFQWEDRLLDTVDDKGPKGYDDQFGAGIVNPYRALTEETTYEGKDGDQVSSPDDRLPLEEQGKNTNGNSDDKKDDDLTSDGAALDGPTSSSTLIVVGVVLTVAIAITVVLSVVIARRRRPGKLPSTPGAG